MTRTADAATLSDVVNDVLVDQHGEDQRARVRGYFKPQALTELLSFIDADDVIEVHGQRTVKDNSESFDRASLSNIDRYTSMEEQLRRQFVLDFDKAKHGLFDDDAVVDFIEDEDLGDLAVDRIVYRFENDDLYDHLLAIMREVYDRKFGATMPESNFEQPFFAVLSAESPGAPKDMRAVEDYNESSLFTDLGWKKRTMDLVGVWSYRAWTDERCVVFKHADRGKIHQEDVEEEVINNVEPDRPVYGALNSKLLVNKWRSRFGRGRTDLKTWQWLEDEGWVRGGGA